MSLYNLLGLPDEASEVPDKLRKQETEQAIKKARDKVTKEHKDAMRKRQQLLNQQDSRMAVSQKKPPSVLLQEHLEALDKQCTETMDRWAAPQDFSKVDLVCAELLKKGSFGDALEYMEKVKKVVEQLCGKLRTKHQESMRSQAAAYAEEEEAGGGGGGIMGGGGGHFPSTNSLTGTLEKGGGGLGEEGSRGSTPTRGMSTNGSTQDLPKEDRNQRSEVVSPTPKPEKPAKVPGIFSELKRDFQALTKEHKELQRQHQQDAKDYQEQIQELKNKLASSSWECKQNQSEVKANKMRLLNRKLDMQAADTRAVQAEKKVRELEDKVEALCVMLRQAEGKTTNGNAQVQHMRQKVADLQQAWGEVGAREAKLAAQLAHFERQVGEKELELRATGKAANTALAKQDHTIARLQDRLDSQALELQRRDEILHTLSTRLQEKNLAIVDFLNPPGAGEGDTAAGGGGGGPSTSSSASPELIIPHDQQPGGAGGVEDEAGPAPSSTSHHPGPGSGRRSPSGRAGSSVVTRSRPPSGAPTAGGGGGGRQGGGGTSFTLPPQPAVRSIQTAPEGARRRPNTQGGGMGGTAGSSQHSQANGNGGGGVLVRITENEGAGAAFKPWIVHQPIRCEPAAHLVVVGVQQMQSVERSQAAELAHQKVCSCGSISSKGHFELNGHVMWRGRTAVIGPPVDPPAYKHRSVLGLESPGENLRSGFSS